MDARDYNVEWNLRWKRFREKKIKFIAFYIEIKKRQMCLSKFITILTIKKMFYRLKLNFESRVRTLLERSQISFLTVYILHVWKATIKRKGG